MFGRNKFAAAGVVVLAGIAFVLFAKNHFSPRGTVSAHAAAAPRAQGNPDAKIKIVEFMDPQCQSCAEVSPLLKNYLYTYPSKIYWQVKFYPLIKGHLHAMQSAVYAECASRQNQFWPFFDALLENQAEWAQAADSKTIFERLASSVAGLDLQALNACVERPDAKEAVLRESKEAADAGVRSTPTFFINGKMAVGPEALREELNRLLH